MLIDLFNITRSAVGRPQGLLLEWQHSYDQPTSWRCIASSYLAVRGRVDERTGSRRAAEVAAAVWRRVRRKTLLRWRNDGELELRRLESVADLVHDAYFQDLQHRSPVQVTAVVKDVAVTSWRCTRPQCHVRYSFQITPLRHVRAAVGWFVLRVQLITVPCCALSSSTTTSDILWPLHKLILESVVIGDIRNVLWLVFIHSFICNTPKNI